MKPRVVTMYSLILAILLLGCSSNSNKEDVDTSDTSDTDSGFEGTDIDTNSDIDSSQDTETETGSDSIGDTDTGNSDTDSGTVKDKWVMGYYVGYQTAIYPISAIDFDHLTHIFMGSVVPETDGSLDLSFSSAGSTFAKNLATASHAAGVVPLLMIGGAGSVEGFRGAASATNLDTFVTNLLTTMDDLGYDGMDLDWEPIVAEDEPLLLALAQALRTARPDMILTMPIGWAPGSFSGSQSFLLDIEPSLDRLNIMTYVMSGAWPGWKSWHSSALKGDTVTTPSSVSKIVNTYLGYGIPSAKLGVGSGFAGMCWTGGVKAPGQSLTGSSLAAVDSQMSYTIIMNSYYDESSAMYDTDAEVPYLSFDSETGSYKCTYISYEDEQSLAAKSKYIKDTNLGGIIIWTINQGYLSGDTEKNPLLKAIWDNL